MMDKQKAIVAVQAAIGCGPWVPTTTGTGSAAGDTMGSGEYQAAFEAEVRADPAKHLMGVEQALFPRGVLTHGMRVVFRIARETLASAGEEDDDEVVADAPFEPAYCSCDSADASECRFHEGERPCPCDCHPTNSEAQEPERGCGPWEEESVERSYREDHDG